MSAHIQPRLPGVSRSLARPREAGYAYILALILLTGMMIMSLIALQKGLAQAKRRQEQVTIWRGEQYVRAIRAFYKKANRYPRDTEELQKGLNGIHFLRPSSYKNPMNKTDGTWRMIYVNPAGQLIGSTRYANLQQMALIVLNNGQMPQMPNGVPGLGPQSPLGPGQPNGTNDGGNGPEGSNPQNANGGSSDANNGGAAGNGGGAATDENGNENQQNQDNSGGDQSPPNSANPTAPQQPNGSAPGTNQPGQGILSGNGQGVNPLLLMKPTGPVSGPVIGGFLTGVALTQETRSQKVYQGGKKYIDWEFIWNPMIDQARALASGQSQGATGSLGGANGINGPNGNSGSGNGFGFGGILGGQPGQQQPPNGQQPQQPQQPPDQNQPQP